MGSVCLGEYSVWSAYQFWIMLQEPEKKSIHNITIAGSTHDISGSLNDSKYVFKEFIRSNQVGIKCKVFVDQQIRGIRIQTLSRIMSHVIN